MKAQKETPPAATEGAEEVHVESNELSAVASAAHESIRGNENLAEIRRPPGLVGDIADYIYGSSHRPMLEAAVMAALGLVAGIAGRCYNVNGDGLNLYLLLLASSGRGKSAMSKGIDRLVTEVRLSNKEPGGISPPIDQFIGPASFASGPAMHDAISQDPSTICVFGEFGYKLRAMSKPNPNEHEEAQLGLLLDVYNKSGRYDELRARRYREKDKTMKQVRSPAMSIICESTPEIVYESLSPDLVHAGLIPRFIIVECLSDRPPTNPDAGKAPESAIITQLGNLVTVASNAFAGPTYTDILIDDDALSLFSSIEYDQDAIYADSNPVERDLWNRALQNIKRVAGLLAVGINMHKPVITEECMRWAIDFIYPSVENLVAKFNEGLVGTGDSKQEALVRKYLYDYLKMSTNDRMYSSYEVPERLARDHTAIGLDYLRRRARTVSAFNKDRRGYRAALDAALKGLTDVGLIYPISMNDSSPKYGTLGKAFRIMREP